LSCPRSWDANVVGIRAVSLFRRVATHISEINSSFLPADVDTDRAGNSAGVGL